jgi:hypothetical protein
MHDENKKWFFAYAMGVGCTTEDNGEIGVAVRRRVAELRAVIVQPRRAESAVNALVAQGPGAEAGG